MPLFAVAYFIISLLIIEPLIERHKYKKAKKKWAWIGVGAWFAGGIISSAVPSIAGLLNILSIAGGVILGIGGQTQGLGVVADIEPVAYVLTCAIYG